VNKPTSTISCGGYVFKRSYLNSHYELWNLKIEKSLSHSFYQKNKFDYNAERNGDVNMHNELKAQLAKQDLSRLRLSSVLLKKLQIDNAVLKQHHRSINFP